jgi:type I restriction enzyme S subunit
LRKSSLVISRSSVILTKTGYKMTEIGEVPEEWDVEKISELKQTMYYGVTAKATEEDTDLRLLRTTDIVNFNFKTENLPFCEITEKKSDLSKYFLKKGDIVVARAGTVGISVLVDNDLNDAIFGSYLIKIVFNHEKVFMKFIHYYFQSQLYWNNLSSAQGSTIKNINLPFLNSLMMPLPPLPEQQKIAEILSTADEAIQKVNEQIALTQQLKKGMMQELLTRGIGHTKFKETEIGEIPEEWDLKPFGEILQIRKRKNRGKLEKLYTIPMDLIPENGTYCEYRAVVSNEIIPPTYCESGDVLLPKITPSVENGKQGIVPNLPTGHAFATSEVYPIVAENTLTNLFTFYLLKMDLFRKPLINSMVGTTGRQRVPKDSLFNLMFPVPTITEQNRITEILSSVDGELNLLDQKRQYMETIKKGIMEDLLTGKVRVKV